MNAHDKMSSDDLIKAFDSLRSKQVVKVVIRAVMGRGCAETGTPVAYIVGRRTRSRHSENVALLPADGSKPHPMRKIVLFKRADYEGRTYVSVAIGDMGATLVSVDVA